MRKNAFLILSFIFLVQSVHMIPVSGQGALINEVKTLELRTAANNKNYNDIDGSPYYTNEFINSTAYLKDGNYATTPLRYDLFRDEVEFRRDGKIFWLIKKDIRYIKYGTEILIVSSTGLDSTKLGYYFVKDTGKYQLIYRKTVMFQPYVQPKGYAESKPDRFEAPIEENFIKKENMPAVRIKTKKDLQTYFKGNKAALDYIKKNKIKTDNIINLYILVNYLNGL